MINVLILINNIDEIGVYDMTLGLKPDLRTNMMDEFTPLIDAGTGAGKLLIYDGSRPATGVAITGQVLLAELELDDPAFGAAVAGVITAGAIIGDTSADATGTATWMRITDSDDVFVLDGSVGIVASGEDLELNTVAITAGVAVDVSSMVLTAGNP